MIQGNRFLSKLFLKQVFYMTKKEYVKNWNYAKRERFASLYKIKIVLPAVTFLFIFLILRRLRRRAGVSHGASILYYNNINDCLDSLHYLTIYY